MYVASFNGINSYVEVPDSLALRLLNTDFTITAWIKKPLGGYNPSPIVDKDDGGTGWGFWTSSDNKLWFWIRYWNRGVQDLHDNVQFSTGWNFVAARYRNSDGDLQFYLNGQPTSHGIMSTVNSSTITLKIGMLRNYLYPFNGSIANVQIYNTALTPQEIQYLYQQGLGGGPIRLGSLVGWWPLNGDAKDYSGNNNHGTINGGVTFVQNYNPP